MPYSIYQVPKNSFDDYEDMGTKSKFWYTDPESNKQYLFKSTHTEDKQGKSVVRTGEDWAEKIACELAETLGIPHARYELAIHDEQRGIRSENFSQPGDSMVFGNTLLEKATSVLKLELEDGQKCQEIIRVNLILEQIIKSPPRGWVNTNNIKDASEVFIGYLLLDCLISNQDRHNENWALIVDRSNQLYLAPSFDHAASLGRNESDDVREVRLKTKEINRNVSHYVKKSKSHFYHKKNRLKIIEALMNLSYLKPKAALEWAQRLEQLSTEKIEKIVQLVPQEIMSNISKDFCAAIIEANKARILEEMNILRSVIEQR